MAKSNVDKYKILNLDAVEIVNKQFSKDESKREIIIRDGDQNILTDKFTGYIDNSLDLEKMQDVYKNYKDSFKEKFIIKVRDYELTTAVINVEFKEKLRSYNEHHLPRCIAFVKCGYELEDVEIKDHICIKNIEGKDELLAIEIPYFNPKTKELDIKKYGAVKLPMISGALQPYFRYDDDQKCYCYNIKAGSKKNDNKPKVRLGAEKLREMLYKDGFNCDGVHYVRYKRSAGSSRVGNCLFIAEPLYDEMMEWSSCGLDINDITDLASWEAYVSLTLSTMKNKITIPKASILFVHDLDSRFIDKVIAVGSDENGEVYSKETNLEISNTIWDGESLLDSSIFVESGYADKGMMLLRNKFFKSCAFNTNLQQWFKDNNITKISELNGFTTAKRIDDIKMVVTESSLKYIKMCNVASGDEEAFRATVKKWLNNIEKYFGVVKTEKSTSYMEGNMVATNYQLINTMQLSREGVEELLTPSIEYIENIKASPMYMRHYLGQQLDYEKEYDYEDVSEKSLNYYLNYNGKIVSQLMTINDDFAGTEIYKDYKRNIVKSIKKQIKHGKILVRGTYATIFGNGAELLQCIIDKNYKVEDSIIKGGDIYTKMFEDNAELLCERNPNITMGNLMVAKNTQSDFYDKYFNLTREIVCVNAINNNIQQRLNGCDYDSDTMLITDNAILLKAVQSNYSKFLVPTSVFTTSKNIYEKNAEGRALLDYRIATNNIGKIVNLSQLLNSKYWDQINQGIEDEETQEIYRDICRLAVLSGAEIDKAKRLYSVNTGKECANIEKKYQLNPKDYPKFFNYIQIKGNQYKQKEMIKKLVGDSTKTSMEFLYEIASDENSCKDKIYIVKEDYKPRNIKLLDLIETNDIMTGSNDYKYKSEIIEIVSDAQNKLNTNRAFVKRVKSDDVKSIMREQQANIIKECFDDVSKKLKNSNILILLLKELDNAENSKNEISKFKSLLFGSLCLEKGQKLAKLMRKNRKFDMYDLVQSDEVRDDTIWIFNFPFDKDLKKVGHKLV